MESNKKKVLFICSDNFPKYGANGKMLSNILNNGLKDEYEVHVLTHKFDIDDADDEMIEDICIHRYFSWFMYPKENIAALKKQKKTNDFYWNLVTKKIIPKIAAQLDSGFFFSKVVSNEIYQSIKQLNEKYSFSAIIPIVIGIENIDAAINYKTNNPGTSVIVYQLDPIGDNLLEKPGSLKKRLQFENTFLTLADAIITTPIIRSRFQQIYPQSVTKKITAMEFPAVTKVNQNYIYDKEKIICLFAGNIYKNIRNPEYTLKLFKALDNTNIELHLLGKCDNPINKELLADNIVLHGSVPIEKASEYIKAANILVNIGNSMTNQVPSKLFEYISTGKPILNIHKNENCPSLMYLDKYDYVINILEKKELDEQDVVNLKQFISTYFNKIEDNNKILLDYYECTAKYCASTFSKVIESVIS